MNTVLNKDEFDRKYVTFSTDDDFFKILGLRLSQRTVDSLSNNVFAKIGDQAIRGAINDELEDI